jgi:hypothetical protein
MIPEYEPISSALSSFYSRCQSQQGRIKLYCSCFFLQTFIIISIKNFDYIADYDAKMMSKYLARLTQSMHLITNFFEPQCAHLSGCAVFLNSVLLLLLEERGLVPPSPALAPHPVALPALLLFPAPAVRLRPLLLLLRPRGARAGRHQRGIAAIIG